MEPVKYKTKCDIVTESIIEDIVNGEYPLLSQLPNENDLCGKYEVSRITIRESLKKLSSMGIISIQQGRGTFVNNVDIGFFMKPLMQFIEFKKVDIITIYEAQLFLETGTCRLAARNRTDSDILLLRNYIAKMDEYISLDDFYNYRLWDVKFHIGIAEISRNEILKACLTNLWQISQAYSVKYKIMDNSNEHHKKLTASIELRDEDAAEAVIVEHVLRAKEYFMKALPLKE